MSVTRLPDGRYKVRWRDALGSHRGKTFPQGRLKEARAYERDRKWDRDHGGYGFPDSRKTLAEVGQEFKARVIEAKQPKTQDLYKWLWNRLIVDYLGDRPIAQISVADVEDWLTDLKTGPEAKRKAASLLSQVYRFAIKRDYCQLNPVLFADRPKRAPKKPVFCPPPEMVEGIRRAMFEAKRPRDAYFVGVLAYAGLRPGEARILTWDDWTNDALIVRAPKTSDWRAVKLLAPLAQDLHEWREQATGEFIFPGERRPEFTASAYNNWAKKKWKETFGPPGVTPYTLRHSFVSLLLRDPDYSRVEIARMTGHSLEVQDKDYAHVIMAGQGSATDAIWDARAKVSGSLRAIEGGRG